MRSIPRGRIVRILILALALVGSRFVSVALSQTADSTVNDYVTIKLKDGRVLEGPVLLEDNQQITIEAQYANGTITHKAHVDKNDIASISHLSATEKEQRLATISCHTELGKYQLDPQNSYPLSYYDSAINEGFRPFLTQYPHALETVMVTNRLAEWQMERAKVASGQVKYHGQWMTAELAQTERTQQIIQDARALIVQGQFQAATEKLAPYYNAAQPPQLAAESRHLQADVYRLWIGSLETLQEQLGKDLGASKERVAQLSQVQSVAQANSDRARAESLNSNPSILGDKAMRFQRFSQANADYLRAEKQYNEEQNRQFAIQEQLDNTIHQLRQIHKNQDLFTAAYPVIEVVKETPSPPKMNAPAPPPPPPPPPPPSAVEEMGAWFGRNWIIVAGAALLGLWGVSHLFTRS